LLSQNKQLRLLRRNQNNLSKETTLDDISNCSSPQIVSRKEFAVVKIKDFPSSNDHGNLKTNEVQAQSNGRQK
jgi:hypothetical protein